MRRPPASLRVLGLVLALGLLTPFAAGIAGLAGADWRDADWSGVGGAAAVSLASATAATSIVALGGVPLGYLLARRSGRRWRLLGLAVQMPLALPPLGSGILLLLALGPGSELTDSLAGIVLAEAFVAAPFAIIAARSAFAAVDPVLEEVAATLGHDPAAVFRRVSLPLAARIIAAGLLLTWLRAFGEFGATVMVAYHPETLPVFTYVQFGSAGLPAMLPVLVPTLGVAALVSLLAAALLRPRPGGAPEHEIAGDPGVVAPAPPCPARAAEPLRLRTLTRVGGFTLDLDWNPGARRLAILGASGSGKSLTLRVLAGLAGEGATTIRLGSRDFSATPPEARPVGYVPQDYGLFPHLAVARQIRFATDHDEASAKSWTGRLGLGPLAGRRPDALSLGQRQRVAIARALARRGTRLLLLDEPFSALDAPLRIRVRDETRRFADGIDATTILVTHDPEEAMGFADELLLLDRGRAIRAGPTETVFRRPASETAARLLGAEAIGTGTVGADGRIAIGDGVMLAVGGDQLPPAGAPVAWAVRPGAIRVAPGPPGYPATVVSRDAAARFGRRRLLVRLGDAVLPVDAEPSVPPGPETVFLAIDPLSVQVWNAVIAAG